MVTSAILSGSIKMFEPIINKLSNFYIHLAKSQNFKNYLSTITKNGRVIKLCIKVKSYFSQTLCEEIYSLFIMNQKGIPWVGEYEKVRRRNFGEHGLEVLAEVRRHRWTYSCLGVYGANLFPRGLRINYPQATNICANYLLTITKNGRVIIGVPVY